MDGGLPAVVPPFVRYAQAVIRGAGKERPAEIGPRWA